ncbi:hypothetical protein CVT24_009422 [Panaeolus cyanescens]|uniref:Zn(2)-C6 fungal-type domain-containing protein n=1 Tax=Panaeolus cyanescens TaxID=181874 RepID=A0A409VAQ7_9AGAR|nr:hypothetical protein CVT24_009422 [Panaeolus cyanescens]
MSSEVANKKKRTPTESNPAPDGDHRKRRRNRTTQSCLNCHTSKRMCDRKRPACARCTQLGLTGLCVYEVDDPSQRTDTQDESARLLKRVAELEGVIRELKNKPHPRWVQGSNGSEDFDKWQPRTVSHGDDASVSSSSAPSPLHSSCSSERGEGFHHSSRSGKSSSDSLNASIQLQTSMGTRQSSPYSPTSSGNTSPPALLTPTEEYPLSHVGIANNGSLSHDYDLASMFLSYPGLLGCHESQFTSPADRFSKSGTNHCGCLHEAASYNTMLELSLRLRKASDVLSRLPHHQLGNMCHLHQRIAELDSFTTNALSDISSTPGDLPDSGERHGMHGAVQGGFHASNLFSPRSTTSQNGVNNVRPWDMLPSNANSPASLDDSFMTWEPPRRS